MFFLLPTSSAWHKVTATFYPHYHGFFLRVEMSDSSEVKNHISFPPLLLYTVYAQGHVYKLLILLVLALWHVVYVVSR